MALVLKFAALTWVAAGVTVMDWDEAYRRASQLVSEMTPEEKYSRMWGQGWHTDTGKGLNKFWYIGYIPGVPRLSIPPLNMEDSSAGFRSKWPEMVPTRICWPSLLALAATWDPALARDYGAALGREFKAKGANILLGPSVNVHRVARGGRNFELLSGEDPVLGAALASEYVAGVQSEGLMAVVKHFAFNHQETNRGSDGKPAESSVVDAKTANELYYPPFQAAVDAGVVSTMCAYNEIEGVAACARNGSLNGVLRDQMGFRGFVMSDWGATHATSVAEGLDMSMPLNPTDDFYSPDKLADFAGQSEHRAAQLDTALAHQFAAMYRLDLFNLPVCLSPPCQEWLAKDVRSDQSLQLAESIATKSIVLLKNDADVLPLTQAVRSIAVVGLAAVANTTSDNPTQLGDYYSGGGSGHLEAGFAVKPLEGIRRALPEGMQLLVSPSDDVQQAVEVASQVDVTIVVAGTTSGENIDRHDLRLDNGIDSLISAVRAVSKRIVILAQIPGAVLTPWRDSVDAIAVLFLGGEATGTAWANILFGRAEPTGRLPISLPVAEEDEIAPSQDLRIRYTEGLRTGYRADKPVAFPFGHGLSYGKFELADSKLVACGEGEGAACLEATVRNVGAREAAAVVQLYLESPLAGQPRSLLKGFRRTAPISAGGAQQVRFALTEQEFRYYDLDKGAWATATAGAVAHLGFSATDLRASVSLDPEPFVLHA